MLIERRRDRSTSRMSVAARAGAPAGGTFDLEDAQGVFGTTLGAWRGRPYSSSEARFASSLRSPFSRWTWA